MVDPWRWPRGASDAVDTVRVLVRSGMLRPPRPDQLLGMAREVRHWGLNPSVLYAIGAARTPDTDAIVDADRRLNYADFHRRTNALANALGEDALAGQPVALLARNSVQFGEALAALAKLGAETLLLNTGFAGPQLAEVMASEGAQALLHDDEFGPLLLSAGLSCPCYSMSDLERLATDGDPSTPPAPVHPGLPIVLTSGTTGTPRGASRSRTPSAWPLLALLSRIPYRVGDRMFIAAPLFHSWGFAHLVAAGAMSGTAVVRPHFDPEETLAVIDSEQITVLAVVPAMLERICQLPAEVRRRYDTSSLRVIASSGSELPGSLAARVMDSFGEILYNLYGSTEVGWVAVATPEDLRAAPGTAGRPMRGVRVRLLDGRGEAVPAGAAGRIFASSPLVFDGYTGGGSKEVRDNHMATGDIGRFDAEGRLFVSGREDDMVVSGGENVFPQEVEAELLRLDGVVEAAVVGVPDDAFGQRLRAYVVRADGSPLTAGDVRDAIRGRLARYKVPRDVVFVDELPRNATGKILRTKLAAADIEQDN